VIRLGVFDAAFSIVVRAGVMALSAYRGAFDAASVGV
jgi:hypothetical protein